MPGYKRNRWPLRLLISGVVGVASRLVLPQPALAQNAITPDATLGGEASQVVPVAPIIDLIGGGALRGTNLFHSFEQFNIAENGAVFFIAPTVDTANIFARVTGGNPSEVLGRLGTRTIQAGFFLPSEANLFLLNPNGILFGPGASLDIGGSFVATTADAIQFGDQGIFSALAPESDNLLEVNPSALWFNDLNPPENIEVRGDSPMNSVFLQVLEGQNLALIGGDINFDYGRLLAPGGSVDVVALATGGVVEINDSDSSFAVPEAIQRANVVFNNLSGINTLSGDGGDISIVANDVTISNGSAFFSGIGPNLGNGESQAGDIRINASGNVAVLNDSSIGNIVAGQGLGGNITVLAQNVEIIDGSQISAVGIGAGNVGSVTIEATENISLSGTGVNGTASGILSSVAQNVPGFENFPGQGDSGNINLSAVNLTLSNRALVSSSSVLAPGRSGNIIVNVDELSLIEGSQVASNTSGNGSAGNISITSRLLNVQDGSSIRSDTSGSGQGGTLIIRATEATHLIGSDTLEAGGSGSGLITQTTGPGSAGLLRLETGQLTLRDGGFLDASTFGSGSAGNVEVIANSIYLTGVRADRRFSSNIRSISSVNTDLIPAMGNAGNISIDTRLLTVEDGGFIETSTFGAGQGGNLTVRATETISIIGSGSLATGVVSSGLSTQTLGSGNAGFLSVSAGQLILQNGATVSASTFGGSGSAGSLLITADAIRLSGIRSDRQFSSTVRSISGVSPDLTPATGNAGNISINTRLLTVEDGGTIETSTFGSGRGGNLIINATEITELIGSGNLSSEVRSSGLYTGTNGSGNAGFLGLATGQLIVRDGATVNASTFGGSGEGGDLNITADSITMSGIRADRRFASTIGSTSDVSPNFVPATGNAGNVNITTRSLTVEDGGSIQASTAGSGQGGDLNIRAAETVNLIGSGSLLFGVSSSLLSTQTSGIGNAGNLRLEAGRLTVQDGAAISASTFGGSGSAGSLSIRADSIRLAGIRSDSQFASSIQSIAGFSPNFVPATGNAGNLSIATRLLTVEDGGSIETATYGPGRGGNLTINATEAVNLTGSGALSFRRISSGLGTQAFGAGNAGNLRLETEQLTIQDGAGISTSTFGGSGSAGNLTVDADAIRLIGVRSDGLFPSSIQSVAGLNLDLIPSTGNAGDLSINTRLLAVEGGGSIQTTTYGPGRGGSLTVTATEAVELTGTGFLVTGPFTGPVGSNLFTGTFGEGNAGPLNLQTDQLRLRDGGIISTRSGGPGRAGDISLTPGQLAMENGTIETDAPFSQGGSISVNTSRNGSTGLITLRGDSDITTNSFGRGGNITLNGIVITFDDSDILARSEDAAGGNITLGPFFSDTLPVGAISPTENNDRVDVSAAGRLADGNITLPDLSFIENSLASLQEVTVDPRVLTAGSCIARSPGDQASFVATGSGGLPMRPGDSVISTYPTGSVQPLPGADPPAAWQPGDPIVEPTGVFALPNGRLVLARACDDE